MNDFLYEIEFVYYMLKKGYLGEIDSLYNEFVSLLKKFYNINQLGFKEFNKYRSSLEEKIYLTSVGEKTLFFLYKELFGKEYKKGNINFVKFVDELENNYKLSNSKLDVFLSSLNEKIKKIVDLNDNEKYTDGKDNKLDIIYELSDNRLRNLIKTANRYKIYKQKGKTKLFDEKYGSGEGGYKILLSYLKKKDNFLYQMLNKTLQLKEKYKKKKTGIGKRILKKQIKYTLKLGSKGINIGINFIEGLLITLRGCLFGILGFIFSGGGLLTVIVIILLVVVILILLIAFFVLTAPLLELNTKTAYYDNYIEINNNIVNQGEQSNNNGKQLQQLVDKKMGLPGKGISFLLSLIGINGDKNNLKGYLGNNQLNNALKLAEKCNEQNYIMNVFNNYKKNISLINAKIIETKKKYEQKKESLNEKDNIKNSYLKLLNNLENKKMKLFAGMDNNVRLLNSINTENLGGLLLSGGKLDGNLYIGGEILSGINLQLSGGKISLGTGEIKDKFYDKDDNSLNLKMISEYIKNKIVETNKKINKEILNIDNQIEKINGKLEQLDMEIKQLNVLLSKLNLEINYKEKEKKRLIDSIKKFLGIKGDVEKIDLKQLPVSKLDLFGEYNTNLIVYNWYQKKKKEIGIEKVNNIVCSNVKKYIILGYLAPGIYKMPESKQFIGEGKYYYQVLSIDQLLEDKDKLLNNGVNKITIDNFIKHYNGIVGIFKQLKDIRVLRNWISGEFTAKSNGLLGTEIITKQYNPISLYNPFYFYSNTIKVSSSKNDYIFVSNNGFKIPVGMFNGLYYGLGGLNEYENVKEQLRNSQTITIPIDNNFLRDVCSIKTNIGLTNQLKLYVGIDRKDFNETSYQAIKGYERCLKRKHSSRKKCFREYFTNFEKPYKSKKINNAVKEASQEFCTKFSKYINKFEAGINQGINSNKYQTDGTELYDLEICAENTNVYYNYSYKYDIDVYGLDKGKLLFSTKENKYHYDKIGNYYPYFFSFKIPYKPCYVIRNVYINKELKEKLASQGTNVIRNYNKPLLGQIIYGSFEFKLKKLIYDAYAKESSNKEYKQYNKYSILQSALENYSKINVKKYMEQLVKETENEKTSKRLPLSFYIKCSKDGKTKYNFKSIRYFAPDKEGFLYLDKLQHINYTPNNTKFTNYYGVKDEGNMGDCKLVYQYIKLDKEFKKFDKSLSSYIVKLKEEILKKGNNSIEEDLKTINKKELIRDNFQLLNVYKLQENVFLTSIIKYIKGLIVGYSSEQMREFGIEDMQNILLIGDKNKAYKYYNYWNLDKFKNGIISKLFNINKDEIDKIKNENISIKNNENKKWYEISWGFIVSMKNKIVNKIKEISNSIKNASNVILGKIKQGLGINKEDLLGNLDIVCVTLNPGKEYKCLNTYEYNGKNNFEDLYKLNFENLKTDEPILYGFGNQETFGEIGAKEVFGEGGSIFYDTFGLDIDNNYILLNSFYTLFQSTDKKTKKIEEKLGIYSSVSNLVGEQKILKDYNALSKQEIIKQFFENNYKNSIIKNGLEGFQLNNNVTDCLEKIGYNLVKGNPDEIKGDIDVKLINSCYNENYILFSDGFLIPKSIDGFVKTLEDYYLNKKEKLKKIKLSDLYYMYIKYLKGELNVNYNKRFFALIDKTLIEKLGTKQYSEFIKALKKGDFEGIELPEKEKYKGLFSSIKNWIYEDELKGKYIAKLYYIVGKNIDENFYVCKNSDGSMFISKQKSKNCEKGGYTYRNADDLLYLFNNIAFNNYSKEKGVSLDKNKILGLKDLSELAAKYVNNGYNEGMVGKELIDSINLGIKPSENKILLDLFFSNIKAFKDGFYQVNFDSKFSIYSLFNSEKIKETETKASKYRLINMMAVNNLLLNKMYKLNEFIKKAKEDGLQLNNILDDVYLIDLFVNKDHILNNIDYVEGFNNFNKINNLLGEDNLYPSFIQYSYFDEILFKRITKINNPDNYYENSSNLYTEEYYFNAFKRELKEKLDCSELFSGDIKQVYKKINLDKEYICGGDAENSGEIEKCKLKIYDENYYINRYKAISEEKEYRNKLINICNNIKQDILDAKTMYAMKSVLNEYSKKYGAYNVWQLIGGENLYTYKGYIIVGNAWYFLGSEEDRKFLSKFGKSYYNKFGGGPGNIFGGQCTWYANFYRFKKDLIYGKKVRHINGNGGDWCDTAKKYGYKVKYTYGGNINEIKIGDAVSYPATAKNPYGHIANVIGIDKEHNMVLIEEMNAAHVVAKNHGWRYISDGVAGASKGRWWINRRWVPYKRAKCYIETDN